MDNSEETVTIEVAAELADHFQKVKDFRDNLLEDTGEDPKVVTQALNSMTRVISEIADKQKEVYNSDTFAILTQRIANILGEVDKDLQERVMDAFREDLQRLR